MDPEFYAFVRYLKRNLPHPKGKRVRVRTRAMKNLYGSCIGDQFEFRITVKTGLEHDAAIDALCHEWAHMLDARNLRLERREEHRQSWGKHYATVYQHYWKFKKEYGDRA